jgi:hypothetical protein
VVAVSLVSLVLTQFMRTGSRPAALGVPA